MEPKPSQSHELSPAPPKQLMEEETLYGQEFFNLVSTLPKEKSISGPSLYQYKGFWFPLAHFHGIFNLHRHFQPHKNDIFLVTPPKSGTTWLKAIIYALLNREIHHPQDPHHPLLSKTPHQLVPFLELLEPSEYDSISNSSDSSTRIFGSHIPAGCLPISVIEDDSSFNCRIVFLCRDIKDTFVSLFHFINLQHGNASSNSLENAFALYSRGVSGFGPVWDQILGYWKESLARPNKVLFMRYEDIKSEPHFELRRLALFLGKPLSQVEESSGLLDQIISLCSFDNMKKLEVNKSGKTFGLKNHTFYRSGEVGDGKKCLTADMAARLDQITEEKFRGSGLCL